MQGKARQGKARQGKARQGKARQGRARQGKAQPGLHQGNTRATTGGKARNETRERPLEGKREGKSKSLAHDRGVILFRPRYIGDPGVEGFFLVKLNKKGKLIGRKIV